MDSRSCDVNKQTPSSDMQEWAGLGTPPLVLKNLSKLGFFHPTPIQKMAIPPAIHQGADIIGAAETGSGKTLAFAIPILQYVLKLHPLLQSPLTSVSGQSNKPTDQKKKAKSKKENVKRSSQDSPVSDKLSRKKSGSGLEQEVLEFGQSVIDLNQVIHFVKEDRIEPGSESGNEHSGSDKERFQSDTSGSDSEAVGPGAGMDCSTEDGIEQEECEVESDENKSILSSDEDVPGTVGHLSVEENSELEEVPKRKRKRISAYRIMRERARAKRRRRGIVVGVSDNIPAEEFQLMLEGKLDVWSSLKRSIKTTPTTVPATSRSEEQPVSQAKVESGCGLIALILTPTRELALQVHAHITAVSQNTGVRVCTVVGGMATEKQERLLKLRPHIVVATPGRLWKLMSEGEPHLCNYDDLHFLVLDEADRMVEFGHYKELGYILDRLNGTSHQKVKVQERQTLVYSATLTIPRRTTERKKKKKITSSQETIESLMTRVGLRENARIVDLTGSKVTVQTLTETKIMCTTEEKDLHLYYFLLVHPGRTIVFVNSIDCLQRVRAILELLEMRPLPLHARMQQRQRLKNLDRFSSSATGLLVASDVAARGLDLPSVEHIIHYQVPRNSELYVHRSGRTARAHREGLSVMLVGPEDLKSFRNICRTLNREDIPNFPIDHAHLLSLKRRVSLARQVHTIEYRRDKARRSERWMSRTADTLGMELDEEQLSSESASWSKRDERQLQELRDQLKELLNSVVLPRGMSHKFPTRDQNHALLSQLQGQRSGLPAPIVLEREKALLLTRKPKH